MNTEWIKSHKLVALLICSVALWVVASMLSLISSPASAPVPQSSSSVAAPVSPPSAAGLSVGDIGYARSTSGSVVVLGTNQGNEDQLVKLAVAKDIDGMEQMVLSGEAFYVDNGTKVRVIDQNVFSKEVRILAGDHSGEAGWTPTEFIVSNP
jgi:hypothetical protein